MGKIICVIGKPCSGKGILINRFLKGKENRFKVVSLGNILRKEVFYKTEIGELIADYVAKGKLVPDYIITNLVINEMNTSKNIILDGFPRNVEQIEDIFEYGSNIDKVINVQVSDGEAIRRATERLVCTKCGKTHTISEYYEKPKVTGICNECGGTLIKRADDQRKIFEKRLEAYKVENKVIIETFKKYKVETVDIDGESLRKAEEEFRKNILMF